MKVRWESWGAWLRTDTPPALVALEDDEARARGLAPPARRPARPMPLEVHLAVTSRCGAGCHGCYLDARPDGEEPPRPQLEAILDALAAADVFTVAFGGGEPTTRTDLADLAMAARARRLVPVLTTSGLGLTPTKIERLRAFGQVNVSYDGAGSAYEAVRGFDGAASAESAIRALTKAGIPVGVNVVLTATTFAHLPATLRRARDLGAREAQLLRYKPAGRGASLDYHAKKLTPSQAASLGPTLRELTLAFADETPAFGLRIDCALVPFLSADPELAHRGDLLEALGIFGCEAGDGLAAVTVAGAVAPCSFLPATDLDAIHLAEGFPSNPGLVALRRSEAPEPCRSCPLQSVCRGGCKVVAHFVGGPAAAGRSLPDPECPRVLAERPSRCERWGERAPSP